MNTGLPTPVHPQPLGASRYNQPVVCACGRLYSPSVLCVLCACVCVCVRACVPRQEDGAPGPAPQAPFR
jgi:hypothetical protein